MEKNEGILGEVINELAKAATAFPRFNSAHEGFAVLKEEVDELWDEVKSKQSDPERVKRMRVEGIQVAAMALRFLIDCCEPEPLLPGTLKGPDHDFG